jgi:putrescine---pyruvate transaminase
MAGLEGLKAKHEIIGDVRGKGLMCALELVADRKTKASAAKDVVATIYEGTYEAGVMVRTSGANIILSPPLIITTKDVERIVEALDAGLAKITR